MSTRFRFLRPIALLLLCLTATVPGAITSSAADDDDAGAAGTDTSLPDTDSAVSVEGRGDFADLEIRINQTENLGNQAVSVKWEGGEPTMDSTRFRAHFLQIMQCWGEDDGTVDDNPGPPPEQCVFGASDAQPGGGRNSSLFAPGSYADDRIIARDSFESYDAAAGVVEPATGEQWMPFHAVDGEKIDTHTDPAFNPTEGGDYWQNSYFDYVTTNEIAAARTLPDGTGQELFEINTGLESSGLGCGQTVLRKGGKDVEPQCWLVIVPRGAAAVENANTIDDATFEGNDAVMISPLSPAAWKNRIAVPLELNSADTVCELSDDARRLVGSELAVRAVSNWQPALCATPGLPPYSYATVSDDSARLQLGGTGLGAPGMVVVTKPFDPATVSEADPVVYAPMALSGLVVGFNLERLPDTTTAGPKTLELTGVRVADLNLTPRLVAKLLTQSYTSQVAIAGETPDDDYEWVEDNPQHLDDDPDFLQFNPEFELLRTIQSKFMGGLVLAAGTSDAATMLWDWILADPEAAEWLEGEPDDWGMRVNPVYATSEDENPSGVPFAPPSPQSFPKSDPYCYEPEEVTVGTARFTPPQLCGTDWFPFSLGFRDAARKARAALDDAKTNTNPDAQQEHLYWRSVGPQLPGTRAMLSLVDSASARQFGLQMAHLSRAGDNDDDREFIAADEDGLLAAVEAMEPAEKSGVLLPDPEADADMAYPLAMLSYAAVKPANLDQTARDEYSAFLDYAAEEGQEPGEELGQLPPGYVSLPDDLRDEAIAAAALVRNPSSILPKPELPSADEPPADAPDPAPLPATVTPQTVPPVSTTPSRSFSPSPEPPTTLPLEVPTTVPTDPAPRVASPSTVPARSVTPATSIGVGRYAVPVIAVLLLLSALGALEITKRPRRAASTRGSSRGTVGS